MQLIRRYLIGFALLLFSVAALAQTPAQQLKALLGPIKTLQANFKQTTTGETAEFVARASGVVKIVRPGQFFWQVNQPGKQIIVINHNTLWLYDVDLAQVTIKKLDASAMALSPASLLSGKLDELLQQNTVALQNPTSSGSLNPTSSGQAGGRGVSEAGGRRENIFILTPKTSGGPTNWIKLLFQGKQLTGLQFANQLSQVTTIQFSQLTINQSINAQTFNIRIPKGTDIVKQ